MPCYHPLTAYQTAAGDVVFVERRQHDVVKTLSLPCGQCIGCRLERSRQWAMRCMHEASLYAANSFVTLTYDDKHLPLRSVLDYPAFQKFLKRLRKSRGSERVRFYMCGEYGPENWRPHYHALLFGVRFGDETYWRKSPSGEKLYRSAELERLWPYGHCEIGRVTFESAAYVARYCVQKVTGPAACYHYRREDEAGEYFLPPEFNRMSLKPGIGAKFFNKWKGDIYTEDYVIVNGKECKPPRYYDKLFNRLWPTQMEEIKYRREMDALAFSADNTNERLAVKEQVARARLNNSSFRNQL